MAEERTDAEPECPAIVYRPYGDSTPVGPEKRVLPEAINSPVFHYTDATATLNIITEGVLWASHISSMNDPLEGGYGWQLIKDRFSARKAEFQDKVAYQLEQAFLDLPEVPGSELPARAEPRSWESDTFILSASQIRDDLNQFRLYGMFCLELATDRWQSKAADGPFEDPIWLSQAVWRPVLYGPEEANTYIDHMLDWFEDLILSVRDDEFEDHGLSASLALGVLAEHIKHESYAHEKEVRLVFPFLLRQRPSGAVHLRANAHGILPYVKVAPEDGENPVQSVVLGPTVSNPMTQSSLERFREGFIFDDPPFVTTSGTRYIG